MMRDFSCVYLSCRFWVVTGYLLTRDNTYLLKWNNAELYYNYWSEYFVVLLYFSNKPHCVVNNVFNFILLSLFSVHQTAKVLTTLVLYYVVLSTRSKVRQRKFQIEKTKRQWNMSKTGSSGRN